MKISPKPIFCLFIRLVNKDLSCNHRSLIVIIHVPFPTVDSDIKRKDDLGITLGLGRFSSHDWRIKQKIRSNTQYKMVSSHLKSCFGVVFFSKPHFVLKCATGIEPSVIVVLPRVPSRRSDKDTSWRRDQDQIKLLRPLYVDS